MGFFFYSFCRRRDVPLGREMAPVDIAVHSLLVGTLIVVGATYM
jgi:hypothetical protein